MSGAMHPLNLCSMPPQSTVFLSNWKPVVLKDLNANLANLTAEFEKATAEKIKCQQEADATNRVISLANRYRVIGYSLEPIATVSQWARECVVWVIQD